MNLLFLDQFSEIGGAQRCMLDLLPALQEQGWRVHAVLPGDGPLRDRLRQAGAPVTAIPCGPYHSGEKTLLDAVRLGLDMRRQAKVISHLLATEHFDRIYVNGPRLMPAIARLANNSIPVIFHAHNHVGQKYQAELLGRSLAVCGARVIACSQFVAQSLQRYVAAGKLSVIPNGVPEMRCERAVRRGPVRVGMIGRIEPEKGQLEFLKAAKLLAPTEIQFSICGSAQPGRYSDEVQQLGADLGVEFRGWREDVRGILNSYDLLIMASRVEGFPRVMLEAFSAGVAVVAFPAGGIPEAIVDNATGFLTRDFTAAGLAERIHDAAVNRARIEEVARNARLLWEERYDVALYRRRMTALLAHCA